MPVIPIVKLPNDVLRAPAKAVAQDEINGGPITRLISNMKDTLAASSDGVGLAAPQIGASVRVFLVSDEAKAIDEGTGGGSKTGKKWEYRVFINPILKKRSREKASFMEGCLSVPGKVGEVTRSEKVYLEWYDENGKKHARGFARFYARVIQHEMDHLDGVLIVERAKKLLSAAGGK